MKNHVRKLVAFLMALLMAFEMAPVAVLAETLTDVPAAQEQTREEISEKLPEEPLAVDNSDAQQLFDRQLTKPTEEPKPEILPSVELGQDQVVVQPVAPEALDSLIQQIEGLTIQSGSIRKTGIKKQAAAGPMKADAPTAGDDSASHTGYAAFDIAPAEGQPQAEQYTVTVDLDKPVDLLADYALEKGRSYTIDAVSYTLYHFHTDEEGNTRMETLALADENVDREENRLKRFTFTTGDFSTFVIKYTVDFHYNGVDYSIPGESQILLSDLIQQLNIMNGDALLDVADVASVSFTDEHLVTVEQVSGLITYNNEENVNVRDKDFLLTSELPFQSNEKLLIKLNNDELITVGVTDASIIYNLNGKDSVNIESVLSELNVSYTLDPDYPLKYVYFDISSSDPYGCYNSLNLTVNGLDAVEYQKYDKFCVVEYKEDYSAYQYLKFNGDQYDVWLYQNQKPSVQLNDGIFVYNVTDEGEAEIASLVDVDHYIGTGNITIPGTAKLTDPSTNEEKEYKVTKIAKNAFQGEKRIETVTFANTDTIEIYNMAFNTMPNLTSIGGEGPVKFSAVSVITQDPKLESLELHVHGSLESIISANDALKTMKIYGLDDNYTINLPMLASSCNAVEELEVHGKVSFINENLNTNFPALETLLIDSTDTVSILQKAFYYDTALKSVEITGGLNGIGAYAFEGCTALKSFTAGTGESSIEIGNHAFDGCSALTTFSIGNTPVKKIGWGAFRGVALSSFEVKADNLYVDSYAFGGVDSLEELRFNGDVSEFNGDLTGAWNEQNSSVKRVIITGSTGKISGGYWGTFAGMTNLEAVVFGGGIPTLPSGAFEGGALNNPSKSFIYIGGNSVALEGYIHWGGEYVNRISVYFNMPKSSVSDRENGLDGKVSAYFTDGMLSDLYVNPDYTEDDSDGTKAKPFASIQDALDYANSSAEIKAKFKADATAAGVGSLNLPFNGGTAGDGITLHITTTSSDSVKIPAGVLEDNDTVEGIVFENGAATEISIAAGALKNCAALERVEVKNSDAKVTIGEGAFEGCADLTSFSCASKAKMESSAGYVIYEANQAKLAWLSVKEAEGNPILSENSDVKELGEQDYTIEYYDICLVDNNGKEVHEEASVVWNKTIKWKALMEGQKPDVQLFHLTGDNVEKVDVEFKNENDTISDIAFTSSFSTFALAYNSTRYHDNTFYYDVTGEGEEQIATISGIYNKKKTEVIIGSKTDNDDNIAVTGINGDALKNNTTITKIAFKNDSVFIVPENAFDTMSALTEVAFEGSGEVTLCGSAFNNCASLTTVNGTQVANINFADGYVFNNCVSLTTVDYAGRVETINGHTFNNCSTLDTIKIGSVNLIEQDAFQNCGIKHFEVINNMGTLKNAFSGSKTTPHTLESFKVGGDVDTLKGWAFNWCSNLKTVEIGGNVGKIESNAFNECGKLDKVVILGYTNTVEGRAFLAGNVRVAVFNGGISTLNNYAFNCGEDGVYPFRDSNNLVYIGSVSKINGTSPFGWQENADVWFNISSDDLNKAISPNRAYYLRLKDYHCAEKDTVQDVWFSKNKYVYSDYGTEENPYIDYDRLIAGMFFDVYYDDRDDFLEACEAAGVTDLNLAYDGQMQDGFDGFVLHILPGYDSPQSTGATSVVDFPADIYNYVLERYADYNPPKTFEYLKTIIFEEGVETINIPDGAMSKLTGLKNVIVENDDAVVTIGADAFKGTKVNTICPAQQTVASADGSVTIAKGADAPIGTALVITPKNGDRRDAVIAAAKDNGLFESVADSAVRVKYFDLSLVAPNGEPVHVKGNVEVVTSQPIEAFTGDNTVRPLEFGFFHITDSDIKLASKDPKYDEVKKLGLSFNASDFTSDFSPYAAALTLDKWKASDGFYTYELNTRHEAVITGYDTGFSGDIINLPATQTFEGEKYRVISVKPNALRNPPEGIIIQSIKFNNDDTITVGAGAFAGLNSVTSIEFAGAGDVQFDDGTAFSETGTGTVSVTMPNGLTAKTENGQYGAVFSRIKGTYTLELDKATAIPANAFKDAVNLTAVTMKAGLADLAEFKVDSVSGAASRVDFANSAIGNSAFEGAMALESFTVEGGEGGFTIGNEAFKGCSKLTELSYKGGIRGLGENALSGTGFTSLKLKAEDIVIAKGALSDCASLQSLEIDGDVERLNSETIVGGTRLKTLVFDGSIAHQLYDNTVRAVNLEVLVVKDGFRGMQRGSLSGTPNKPLNVYIGGSANYCKNPTIFADAFPAGSQVRIYLDLPITREEATQSYSLADDSRIVDLAYSKDQAPTDLYVNTGAGEAGGQNGSVGAPFGSMAKAKEAVEADYDHAKRFKAYFNEAGFDPDANGLTFAEGSFNVDTFTLHVVGGTTEIDDTFKGNEKLTGLEIDVNGDIAIVDKAFSGCAKLETVSVEAAGNFTVGDSAFSGDTALEKLDIQEVADLEIGVSAFANCEKLPDFVVKNAQNVTVKANAFENCAAVTEANIQLAKDVTFEADAFKGTAVKEVNAGVTGDVTFKSNAFKGVGTLESVVVDAYVSDSDVTIETGAFADCGELEKVLVKNTNAPTIQTGAFSATTIGVLRLDGGASNVATGGVNGGTSYIDGSDTFDYVLAERIGSFENILLNNAKNISESAKVFSGNDSLKIAYLGAGSAVNGGTKGMIFDGMPDDAEAYVAHKQADFADANRPSRENGVLRFLDIEEALYIDGTNNNENPDGSKTNGFKTFKQAKASISSTSADADDQGAGNHQQQAGGEYYFTEPAKALREAFSGGEVDYQEMNIRFPIPNADTNNRVFLVIGTVTVTTAETWQSNEGSTITLLRDESLDKPMIVNNSSLRLSNVVLDGGCRDVAAPIIKMNGGSLILEKDAVLRNNQNISNGGYDDYGGAVAASRGATITMEDGSVVEDNSSLYGGGIMLHGGSTLNMEGGEVRNNTAKAIPGRNGQGGGIMIMGSTMNFSGGSVHDNKADGIGETAYGISGSTGGGIKVGIGVENPGHSVLNMTGGTIANNESTAEGGGVNIESGSVANVSGGEISGNKSHSGLFGGGGFYVNGNRSNNGDGVLNLTCAVVTGNTSSGKGGGLAACGTSTSHINLTKGSAIWGNASGDGSEVYLEYSGYNSAPPSMKAYVSPYMFDGTEYDWVDLETGEKVNKGILGLLSDTYALDTSATGPSTGAVIISGNTADTRGGGIGSNGTVNFGDEPKPSTVKMTPEVYKMVVNRDMKDGQEFTFTTYLEGFTAKQTMSWGKTSIDYCIYKDELLGEKGQAKVKLVKAGEKNIKIVEGFPTYSKDVTASNLGDSYTLLVVEETQDSDAYLTDKYTYYAFRYTVGMSKDGGLEAYLESVTKGECGRNVDGTPNFDKNTKYDSFFGPEYKNRIRTELDLEKQEKAVFINTMLQRDISADKTWLNYDGTDTPPNGMKVVFELLADGKPFEPTKTITLDGVKDESLTETSVAGEFEAWKATWKELPVFKAGHEGEEDQKIEYTVKEIEVKPADYYEAVKDTVGISKDDMKVTDPIQNKRRTGDLEISKTLISDRTADKDQTFTFTVELSKDPATDKAINYAFDAVNDGNEKTTVDFKNGVAKITLKGGQSKLIKGLPTGVSYTVTEAKAEGFKLTGKTGDTGTISTTKSEAKFTNSRETGDLEISKALISDAAADAEQVFTFTVKVEGLTDGEHTYSGVKFTDGEATVELKGGQSKLIEGLPTGVTYTVTEAKAEDFKLTGKTGDTGTISTTKSTAEFTNSRDTGDLEVTKTIHSNAAVVDKDAEFQFTVKLNGLTDKAANKTYGEMTFKDSVATFTLKDGESKKATGLPIGITYTVEETPVKGYTADKATLEGTIKTESSTAAFVNTYKAEGDTPLAAEKQITGRDFQAGDEWTFTVTAEPESAPLPEKESVTIQPTSGDTVQIDFGKIKFTEADDGKTYTYTITETGTVAGVTNDGAKTVTVKVKDNKDGTLTITNSAEETKPVFVNPYHAAGKITLEATKTIENRDFQAGDKWTFTVTADKSEAPMPKTTSVTIEPTEGKTAAIDFGDIEYTEADVDETYVYTITETGTVKGVSNDSVKTATVKITDNGDGTLKVEKTYNNGSENLTFTNTYNADGETTLKGAKKIAGREFKAGDKWTFTVTAQPADAPMPEKTEITVEPTEGSSVDLDFGKIAYQLADLKGETSASFTYTITETGAVKGVTNDSAKTVTIQVTDNKDGTLKVENSANETSLVFTNTYDAKGEVTLSARKVLEGRELKEGEFSFQLKDKNGTVLQTKANALDGSVTFDKIAYTLADVKNSPFTYTINEVEPADKSVIFDRTVKTVTVTLTDKGDGTVQAVADKTAEELTFTNQVTLVKVKKTDLDTGKALAGATIQILDKDGNVLDEWVTTLENHESRGLKIGEEYTIRETVAPAGYAVTTEFTFTIDETGKVHSIAEQTEDGALKVKDPPETTEATVKKVWMDADDADGIRPEKLTVKLSNGEQYELNAENEWTVTVKDLPKYEEAEDGTLQEIAYTWQEVDLPEGYTLTNTETQGTVTTLTNSHDAGKISLSVMKIWQDDGNRDGIRPVSLTVDLYADGVPSGKSVILRAENNWFATLSDLDKIKDGAEITYQWVENLPSTYKYTLTNEATVGSITMLTNTYQPEKTAVKVRKDWDDHENAAKLRPESIQVQLYANGVACGAAVALSAANGWHYEWTNLNKYDNPKGLTGTQQAISYTVEEIGTPVHYSSALAGSQTAGYIITNKLAAGNLIIEKTFEIVPVATVVTPTPTPTATPEPTPEPEVTPEPTPEAERIDIPVTKVWKDNDDRDGNRPAVVTVHLLADGTEVASAVLSSTNSWSHTFVSLPTRNGEDVIQYTVTEDPVEWYQTQVSGFTITNVYRPEVTSVTVQKVWDDDNNALGMRPAAIVVVLSNGQAVTLNEYNGWRATVNNLPTRVNGQPVTYTWHEQEVLGYVQTGYYVTGDTTVFTNSIHRRLVEPPENAPKKKRGETYYVLDDYETPLGVEVTINHVGDCFD